MLEERRQRLKSGEVGMTAAAAAAMAAVAAVIAPLAKRQRNKVCYCCRPRDGRAFLVPPARLAGGEVAVFGGREGLVLVSRPFVAM